MIEFFLNSIVWQSFNKHCGDVAYLLGEDMNAHMLFYADGIVLFPKNSMICSEWELDWMVYQKVWSENECMKDQSSCVWLGK